MSNDSALEISTGPEPRLRVIWLHGLGADGHDFAPIVPELALPFAVRYVFPHAPVRPVTINAGMPMRAWFDISALRPGVEDEAGIRASEALVAELIAREQRAGAKAEEIVLAGFSQGGALALHAGLRARLRLAGILALSSYLPLASRLQAEASPANRETPIFLAHGAQDPVIPIELGIASKHALEAAGYAVAWHRYPMAHSVCAEEIEDIRDWLAARAAVAG
jgi:phospholipase/carboxylesterase